MAGKGIMFESFIALRSLTEEEFRDLNLTTHEQALLYSLSVTSQRGAVIFRNRSQISDLVGFSKPTVNKAIKGLIDKGLLEVGDRKYRITEVVGQKLA